MHITVSFTHSCLLLFRSLSHTYRYLFYVCRAGDKHTCTCIYFTSSIILYKCIFDCKPTSYERFNTQYSVYLRKSPYLSCWPRKLSIFFSLDPSPCRIFLLHSRNSIPLKTSIIYAMHKHFDHIQTAHFVRSKFSKFIKILRFSNTCTCLCPILFSSLDIYATFYLCIHVRCTTYNVVVPICLANERITQFLSYSLRLFDIHSTKHKIKNQRSNNRSNQMYTIRMNSK